jgi:hypothetical protein
MTETKSLLLGSDPLMEDVITSDAVMNPVKWKIADKAKLELLDDATRKADSVHLKSKQVLLRLELRHTSAKQSGSRWKLAAPSRLSTNATPPDTPIQRSNPRLTRGVVPQLPSKKDPASTQQQPNLIVETVSDLLDGFNAGTLFVKSLLTDSSRGIRGKILKFRCEQELKLARVLDCKSCNLTRIVHDIQARSEGRKAAQDRERRLNQKREINISQKQREFDQHMNTSLTRRKTQAVLGNKRLQIRILMRRSQIIEHLRANWISKQRRRINLAKLQAKREKNIETRIQERQRRVNENQWIKERQGDAIGSYVLGLTEPKINAAASVVESIKTSKTGSSAAVARRLQQELLQEKAEFLDRLDRRDRINAKISKKGIPTTSKSPNEIEIDKFLAWKAAAISHEQRILDAKVNLTIGRMKEMSDTIDRAKKRWETTQSRDAMRALNWEKSERRRAIEVVEKAVKSTPTVGQLIPCLAI